MSVVPKKIVLRLKSSAFLRNMLIVMSGTVIAQVIGFLVTPIISRMFSPADFGILGSFNAIVIIISAGITLDYSQAIMLPKEKNDALHLLLLSLIATFSISLLCVLACLVAPDRLMGFMKATNARVLPLFVFATLVTGFNVAVQGWCVRIKAFRHTAASQVIRSLSSNGMQIGAGLARTGPFGLIVSGVLADLFASLNLLRALLADLRTFDHVISLERMKQLAKKYRDFPLYSASQDVINAASNGLPVLILTHFFGVGVAGAYVFGIRLLIKPTGLITRALRQVLFQRASERQHEGGRLLPLYVKTTVALFALGLLPTVVLILWSPSIFAFVFGAQWYTAGEYARSLIVWVLFAFCNVPAVLFARLVRIQRTVFVYNVALLAARMAVLVIGGLALTAFQTITALSLVGGVMNLILILLVGYSVMKKEGSLTFESLRDAWR